MLIRNLNLISVQSWTHLSASDESVCHVTFDEPSHVPKHPCISPKFKSKVSIECPELAQNFQGLTNSPSEVVFLSSYDSRLTFFQLVASCYPPAQGWVDI